MNEIKNKPYTFTKLLLAYLNVVRYISHDCWCILMQGHNMVRRFVLYASDFYEELYCTFAWRID